MSAGQFTSTLWRSFSKVVAMKVINVALGYRMVVLKEEVVFLVVDRVADIQYGMFCVEYL